MANKTMSELEVIDRYGPIRYYEINVRKRMVASEDPYNQPGRYANPWNGYHHSQTIRCYSREELEDKLLELKSKAPKMKGLKLGRRDTAIPIDSVSITVWPVVRGYSSFKRYSRWGCAGRLQDLKPIYSQTFEVLSAS